MQAFFKLVSLTAILVGSLQLLSAQDLRPRAYVITPIHSNAVIVGYAFNDGSIFFGTVLPITNASGQYSVPNSKYPPAEPEALRLLAPQRGLIATAEKQKQLQRHEAREATGFGKTKATAGGILPEFSKFDCLPGRAGGTPISLGSATLLHLLRSDNAAARKRASASGHRQHKLGKNPFQLGGSFVFAPGNRDLYAHVSKTFGDTASVAELLAVIP